MEDVLIYLDRPCLSNAVKLCPWIDIQDIAERLPHLQEAGDVVWTSRQAMFMDLLEYSKPFRQMSFGIIDNFVVNLIRVKKHGQHRVGPNRTATTRKQDEKGKHDTGREDPKPNQGHQYNSGAFLGAPQRKLADPAELN